VSCASASCPSSALTESSFVGTNFCRDGLVPEVGPGMLANSSYDVAAFYFGAQYCGICQQKLNIMYEAWQRLSGEWKARTLVAGVGLEEYAQHNYLFCTGTISSVVADELWSTWQIQQRDVVIFVRTGPQTWRSYCKFTMNLYDEHFEQVLHHVLKEGSDAQEINLETGTVNAGRAAMGRGMAMVLVGAIAAPALMY
ncbi:unnamed protein product, partial [Symbiodinium sp. KB8]